MKSWLCVLALGLFPFVAFWQVATFRQIPLAGDILNQYYPAQYQLAELIGQGTVPLWNERLFSGTPLMSIASTLYPLNLPFLLLSPWKVLSYSVLLHLALAGIFTFLFARALGLQRRAALLAGVVFALCGFSIAHLGHHNINRTIPWLPLILWAIEKWRQSFNMKYVGVGALATGIMFLGGHPQIPVYAMGVAIAYILFFTLWPDAPGRRWKTLLGGVTILGVGLVIAAPLAWDLYEMGRTYGGTTAGDYGYCTNYSLPPELLARLVFPRAIRDGQSLTEYSGYVGILPLGLALVAMVAWRHKARFFFGLVAVAAVVLALGKYTPLYGALCQLPVYGAFQAHARNWYEFDLALAVLAGAGLDSLASASADLSRRQARWVYILALGFFAAAILAVPLATRLMPQAVQRLQAFDGIGSWKHPTIWIPLLMLLVSGVVLLVVGFKPRHPLTALLVLAVIAVDLKYSFANDFVGMLSTPLRPSEVFEQQPDSVSFLKRDTSLYRVLTWSPVLKYDPREQYALLVPNLNTLFGIDSADGYNGGRAPLQYLAFSNYSFNGINGSVLVSPRLFASDHNNVLDLLNVKYILVPVDMTLISTASRTVDGIALDNSFHPGLHIGAQGLVSTTLKVPSQPVTTLAIASTLQGAAGLPDGKPVARLTAVDQAGQSRTYDLVAGRDTAEETYTCQTSAPAHRQARVAYPLPYSDPCAHDIYFDRVELASQPVQLREIILEYVADSGQLYIDKMSLYNAQTKNSIPISVAQGNLAYLSTNSIFHQVYQDRYVRIYENSHVLPRARLVERVEEVDDVETADQVVNSGVMPDGAAFVPSEVALVETSVSWPPSPPGSAVMSDPTAMVAEVVSTWPGRAEITTRAGRAAFLIYSENYSPYWHAMLDGRPVDVYRTDGALLGIAAPEGEHSIVLEYAPPTLYLTVVSYGVLLLIVISLTVSSLAKALRRTPTAPSSP
jgi:uncharacterized membrane protein